MHARATHCCESDVMGADTAKKGTGALQRMEAAGFEHSLLSLRQTWSTGNLNLVNVFMRR